MKKVNLFEELLQERNKQISTNELTSLLKNIWNKEDSKKDRITQSLKDANNGSLDFRPWPNLSCFLKVLWWRTAPSCCW